MLNLNEWVGNLPVAEDTKKLLKELIKRKDKRDHLKWLLIYLTLINGFIMVMILFWLSKINTISQTNVLGVLDYFSSSRAARIFVFVSVSSFITAGVVSTEYKKKKEKYQLLREEVSRKISATWKVNDDSKLKDEISEMLKSQKDINIRFRAR